MDPNATLAEIRQLTTEIARQVDSGAIIAYDEYDALRRLCELMQGLDEWITLGGFLPADWATRGLH